MQNRYAGDIINYVKLSLLRTLSEKKIPGIAWYLFPDSDSNDPAADTEYLEEPEVWRSFDPELFDTLSRIANAKSPTVQEIENSETLAEASYSGQLLETNEDKAMWREKWFQQVLVDLRNCDPVFVDPDGGLCLDENFHTNRQQSWKRLPLSEAIALSEGRTAIIHHANTQFPGGHYREIDYWMNVLPGHRMAYFFNHNGGHTFFVLNATPDMEDRMRVFSQVWAEHGELFNARKALFSVS